MRIHHIAIWVDDLEIMHNFYLNYFDTSCGEKYINPIKQFQSYFISFDEGGCRIELMHRNDINGKGEKRGFNTGLAHFAITVGDRQFVNKMVEQLRQEGYSIVGEPRLSGDGYYEAVFLDPEGNMVEIIAE
ncbi:lactoylglutathione lyase [Pedobacter sp. UYP24]